MSRYGLIDRTVEGRQRLYFPHFFDNKVPLKPAENETWRFRAFATASPKDRKQLIRMCREDFLFWLTGFVSIYDAGDESGEPGRTSFIPYPFQIEMFTSLWSAMYDARCQVRVKKPRRMGVSWGVAALFEHCWQFMGERQLLIGSHREEAVEGAVSVAKAGRAIGEWSRLLPKFDYIQIYQPTWMLPNDFVPRMEPYRTKMKFVNPETGAIIWGTSASSRSAHGDRGWAAWWDEAAKTQNLYEIIGGLSAFSPCKIWTSTIGDLSHPFSTVLKESPSIVQVPLSWEMHPDYAKGITVNEETGDPTSPWLERKLSDINYDPMLANSQYLCDEGFQVGSFYGAGETNSLRTIFGGGSEPGTLKAPVRRGELVITESGQGPVVTGFADSDRGRWKLWFDLDDGKPPHMNVVWGADVAQGQTDNRGQGNTNSTLCVLLQGEDRVERVASCAAHGLVPYEFAQLVALFIRWLCPDREPPGNYDNIGPGGEFGMVLRTRFHYDNLWVDPSVSTNKKNDPAKRAFGWNKGRDERSLHWFALHRSMIAEGKFIERDEDCAVEMREFQYDPTGKGPPLYLPSMKSQDPSGARENHGDRVIGAIAALIAAVSRPWAQELEEVGPKPGSWDWFERMDEITANEAVVI